MKKFIFKLIKTILLIYFITFGVQLIVDFYLAKENSCNTNTWHKIYSGKLNTEIAILGTSRAEVHYDPEIIGNITGLKTYNLGISGTKYDCLSIRWQSFINRNKKPQILILDLDAGALKNSKELYGKFQYLPFSYSKEYKSVAKNLDSDYLCEKIIPLYKYRAYEMSVYKQLKSLKNPKYCPSHVNGYFEHDIKWIERDYQNFKKILQKDKIRKEYDLKIYSKGLSTLNSITEYCKKHNIQVYFIWSPSYYESHPYQLTLKNHIDSILTKAAKEKHIKYFNFTKDSLCNDKKYFYNSSHMNKNGTVIFSKKIGELIVKNSN